MNIYQKVLTAITALPKKELIYGRWEGKDCGVCAVGALLAQSGYSLKNTDKITYAAELLNADYLDIKTIISVNDKFSKIETNEERYTRMVNWLNAKAESYN